MDDDEFELEPIDLIPWHSIDWTACPLAMYSSWDIHEWKEQP